ncbi:MAG: tRNA (adenosine(37)-N6)-threonylcarbamoyltransferase complex ATPase subunit type 1 TsaE [Salibacteraceae bacterium]
MVKEYSQVTLSNLQSIAEEVVKILQTHKVVLFFGHMGAGKTTFINLLCETLEVKDQTSSPTFAIVNEYERKNKELVYHFDFYRLKSEMEAYDLGYEDYLYSGNVCLIEWPEKIANLLPNDAVEFHINGMGDKRDIKIIW